MRSHGGTTVRDVREFDAPMRTLWSMTADPDQRRLSRPRNGRYWQCRHVRDRTEVLVQQQRGVGKESVVPVRHTDGVPFPQSGLGAVHASATHVKSSANERFGLSAVKKKAAAAATAAVATNAKRVEGWTEARFRAMTKRVGGRWKVVSLRGKSGADSKGVVDLVAVRRNLRLPAPHGLAAGDLLDSVIVRLHSADAAKPTPKDVARLRRVARRYAALRIVLHTWTKGVPGELHLLEARAKWKKVSAAVAFV